MSTVSKISKVTRVAAVALAFSALTVPMAEARPGGGFSVGSRGLKTFTPPPATRTAPGTAQGMQRSAQPAPQAAPRPGQATPAAPVAARSRFGTGFMGGLLGAGLIGALFGAGFFGGIGGLLGGLGLLLQVAVIGWLGMMAYNYFVRRNQSAAAGAGSGYQRASFDAGPAGGGTSAAPGSGPSTQAIKVDAADYASFERLLSVIQLSFGREDQGALRSATTPEMLTYFTEQLEDNAKKGVHNELGEPKLLSGDLSEAWREASGEYATVAMQYTLTDATIDRASNRVVSGSRTAPQEVTELWTFMRRLGGSANSWRLSAIQQTA